MGQIKIKRRGKPGVTPIGAKTTLQQTTGFGYVIIPGDVDRDNYVETCFRKCRISIVDDANGNVIHDCYITNEALQHIRFPRVVGEKGMSVVWVSQPYQTVPMIIGTFLPQEEISQRGDEEFSIYKFWDKGLLEINGSAKDGNLFINVRGQEFSYIKISANGNEKSLMEITSAGSINVNANEDVRIKSYKNLTAKVIDPVTKNESGISVNKDELTIASTYGEEDNKNTFKTTVTTAGVMTDVVFNGGTEVHEEITEDNVKTTAKIGDSDYENTIDAEKALIKFMDSYVELKDGKASVVQGGASMEIEDEKWAIINRVTGLKDLLTKIVDTISTLTVTTPMGPSGTPLPPTILKTTELTQLLGQFFNK